MALQDLTPQLRTRLRKVEWFVVLFLGGAVLLMLGSLGWFIKKTGDARGWWVVEVPYYTYVSDATGIKVGTPVQMMGFKVGEVTKVDALQLAELRSWDYYLTNRFRVYVGFKVRDPYPGYINSDSRVTLGGFPIEIAGGVMLELSVGSPAGTLTTTNLGGGGEVGVLSDKFAYDALVGKTNSPHRRYLSLGETTKGFYLPLDQSDTLLAQAQQTLAVVRGISTKVNDALPGLTNELQRTLVNMRDLTDQLKPALGEPGGLGALLLPTNLVARFDRPGGLGDLLVPTNLNAELIATLSGVRATVPGAVSNLNERTAPLGLLLTNLTTSATTLGQVMTNLDHTLGEVRSNTVPEANALLRTLDSFVEGLKRHWLFRGAFKTPKTNAPPVVRDTNAPAKATPPSRARF